VRRLQVPRLFLACLRAGQRGSALVTAHLALIMRPVLGDACWAAVMAHDNAWLQCAVSGDSPARPGLSAISQCGNAATGMCVCAAWKVLVRGAGAEASESTRVKCEAEQLPMRSLGFRLGFRQSLLIGISEG
jgi:hypothetical protein